MRELLANLPKVDKVLVDKRISAWQTDISSDLIKQTVQAEIELIRQAILSGEETNKKVVDFDHIIQLVDQSLEKMASPSLITVINGTGTILHTNLGRAPLSEEVMQAIAELGPSYSNLEYNLEEGKRGSRYDHLKDVLRHITGAEDALVVNNNAAAVLLMLSALTNDKEVLISRGELVEIGGAFRIPDVITRGGAILQEVGSTNKTHLKDYANGINENSGAILRVHTSNYSIVGFTEKVDDKELVELAHDNDLLALNDLGSGLFMDMQAFGLPYEPTVQEAIEAGFDLVTFSGDKLLGGPQAGIIVGKKALLDKLRSHPLTRALRTDKITLAALEVTMRQYLNPNVALKKIPILRMMGQTAEELQEKANSFSHKINNLGQQWTTAVTAGESQIGGGSYPGTTLPTFLVEVMHESCGAAQLEYYLRSRNKPIIARIAHDTVQFDVRTLSEADMEEILDELNNM